MSAPASERPKLLLTVCLAGWGLLTGCPQPDGVDRKCPECPIPVVRAAPQESCPDWRWIGILDDSTRQCPARRGWEVRPLFAPTSGKARPLPAGLRKFCLYEQRVEGPELRKEDLPGLAAIARDCMAVFPAASSAAVEAGLPKLEEYFLRHAGGFTDAVPGGPTAVRLAVVDTAPTNDAPAGNGNNRSPHGYTLANMAERLSCGDGGCVARVTAQLALPWVVYDRSSWALSVRDDVRGGFFGLVGELAEAIRKEVVDWQPASGSQSLVLNLSVGWNGWAFGGLQDDLTTMPPAAQAVHAALVDAVCRGVPALAAAGNSTWGPEPAASRGPLLPAAWERRLAPTAAECATALSPDTPVPAGPSSYSPLIHAVGAIDIGRQPLGNARLDAEPRLVAFGDHAVVTGKANGKSTAMLTGSSVATLIASAALTRVRAYRPDLDVFAAVDRLYESGEPVGRPAAFCLGAEAGGRCPPGNAPPVHRVFAGKAAQEACESCTGPGCPSPCPKWKPPGTDPPDFSPGELGMATARPPRRLEQLRAVAAATHSACPPAGMLAAVRAAAGLPRSAARGVPERFHGSGQATLYRCPHWQLFATTLDALTGPQPGSDPCPNCGFGGGGGGGGTAPGAPAAASGPAATAAAGPANTLYIEIDKDYVGTLSSPVLKVGNQTYALGVDLAPGDELRIEGVAAGPDDTLQLSFVVNGIRSATSLFLRTR